MVVTTGREGSQGSRAARELEEREWMRERTVVWAREVVEQVVSGGWAGVVAVGVEAWDVLSDDAATNSTVPAVAFDDEGVAGDVVDGGTSKAGTLEVADADGVGA